MSKKQNETEEVVVQQEQENEEGGAIFLRKVDVIMCTDEDPVEDVKEESSEEK